MIGRHANRVAASFRTSTQVHELLKTFETQLSPGESVRVVRWHGTDLLLKVVDESKDGCESLMAMMTIDGRTGQIKRGEHAAQFSCARGAWKCFIQQRFHNH